MIDLHYIFSYLFHTIHPFKLTSSTHCRPAVMRKKKSAAWLSALYLTVSCVENVEGAYEWIILFTHEKIE